MTYGPPQRFKAVDINSGDEISHMAMEFWCCDESNEVLVFDCAYHTNIAPHEWHLDINEVKFYQSTGHHDANGKEIFSCDVLCDELGRIRQFFWNGSGWKMPTSKNDAWPDLLGAALNNGLDHFVIGNIHHSPEQLQAAAEKVRAEREQ